MTVLVCMSYFVKCSDILKGSQVKQHWWSFHSALYDVGKTYLFHSSADMKET